MSVTINGTTGVAGVDGAVGTPSYQGNDSNTGIFFPAADTIAFAEGGVESMRLDPSGNLLVGTSNSVSTWGAGGGSKLQIAGSTAYQGLSAITFASSASLHSGMLTVGKSRGALGTLATTNNGDSLGFVMFEGVNSSNTMVSGSYITTTQTGAASSANIPAALQFFTSSGSADPTERMRITASGVTCIRTTSPVTGFAGGGDSVLTLASGANTWGVGPTTSFGNFYILWGGTLTGVALNAGSTSWGTASDERIKDIIEPISGALDKVGSLRAVIGKYKTDDEGTRRSFLIAQDVLAVLPEAVSEEPNEQKTLNLRYTEVIPLLVSAIKELKAELDMVKAELQTLKGATNV